MVSFKASVIDTVNIIKIYPNKTNKPHPCNFIELDTQCHDDYEAIRAIGRSWENGASYAGDLFDRFSMDRFCSFNADSQNRYFAITEIDENNLQINSNSVLGVAAISSYNDNTCFINQLQVDPEHKFGSKRRIFKHIGKKLLESIIKILPTNKEIKLYAATKDAAIFYEKLNFEHITNSTFMRLKR